MLNKGRRFSYTDQKNQRHRFRWIFLAVFIFFVVFTALTSLFFSMEILENETMAPNLRAGERFIFSSFNIYSIVPMLNMEKGSLPFKRGNIVMVDMYEGKKPGLVQGILDSVIRFFSVQRISLGEKREFLFVKRVIGLPGDEIAMNNYVIRVKVKDSAYSLTEFEVTEQDYTPEIPQTPALWDSSLPFSGNMETIVLAENECFVLSDDRSNTNDSRTWGPVPIKNIRGKALFRYWPITRFGPP